MWQLLSMHKVQGSTPRTGKQRETGGGEEKGGGKQVEHTQPPNTLPGYRVYCFLITWLTGFCSCCILCHEDNRVCIIVRAKNCLWITTGWSW